MKRVPFETLPEVQAGKDATEEQIDAIRIQRFQQASWILPTKPRKPADIDNTLGIIKQGNKKLYVIRKPNRQSGDSPKVQKKFKLPQELVDQIKLAAENQRVYEVDIVERALIDYFRE